jgi:hypothetical protein
MLHHHFTVKNIGQLTIFSFRYKKVPSCLVPSAGTIIRSLYIYSDRTQKRTLQIVGFEAFVT